MTAETGVVELTYEQLSARLNDRSLLKIDVLPPESFRLRRIPGSINLPLQQLASRLDRLPSDRETELLIYCSGPG
jgi:rhodanese-related sulfurtransferase